MTKSDNKDLTEKQPSSLFEDTPESNQLNIFRDVFGVDKPSTSNLFLAWDFHPVYCVSRQEQAKMKKANEVLPILSHDYEIDGQPYTLNITPAQIKTKNGIEFFYPSEREEIIEHALRKLFMEKTNGFHIPNKSVWIKFTLKQLQKELSSIGHGVNLILLKESLDIMLKCSIEITEGRKKTLEGGIFITRMATDREDYLKNGKSEWAVKLNDLVTEGMDKLDIRQYNSKVYLQSKQGLSRWIYKQLVKKYVNANLTNTFKIEASTIIKTCRLTYKRDRDSWRKIRQALEELKKSKDSNGNNAVISADLSVDSLSIQEIPIKHGNKKVDITFVISPSKAFVDFVRASNARESNIKQLRGD